MLYDMHWLEVTQGLNPRSDYRQDDNNPSNESGIDHSVKVKWQTTSLWLSEHLSFNWFRFQKAFVVSVIYLYLAICMSCRVCGYVGARNYNIPPVVT